VHFAFGWDGALGKTSLYDVLESGAIEARAVELGELGEGDEPASVSMWGVRGIEHTSNAFRAKTWRLFKARELDPDLLLAVMSFETAGTFDPRITSGGKDFDDNPNAATGLIQFTKKYAPPMVGKTTAELAQMTAVEQLDYVAKWYDKTLTKAPARRVDYYLAVFAPAAIGKPDAHVIYPAGSNAAKSNPGMQGPSGDVTVASVRAKFEPFAAAQEAKPRVTVQLADSEPPGPLAGVAVVGVALGMAALLEFT
jgi:hypothetical protein